MSTLFADAAIPARVPHPGEARARTQLLLLEDNPADVFVASQLLSEAWGDRFELRNVPRVADLSPELVAWADCLLVDLSLGDVEGLACFEAVQQRAPETPLLVFTGRDDEATAMAAMKGGAQDYLHKGDVDGHALGRAIFYARERKDFERELVHRALHDPLTGLPNRRLFHERLSWRLSQGSRSPVAGAVLFIDLNRFKNLNDSHGHEVGDRLIAAVGARLSGILQPGDTIARFGGDEFIVLLDDVAEATEAVTAAHRLADEFARPVVLDIGEIFVGVSIGVSLIEPGDDADAILRKADSAMYRAKATGTRVCVFDESLRQRALVRLRTESELHHAVADKAFRVVYQPVLDLASGRCVGAEALVRWLHPSRGLIGPDQFIPLAEATGLIVPIDDYVLRDACSMGSVLTSPRQGLGYRLSVNLSARDLLEADLAERVRDAIEGAHVDPDAICLELTESVLMEDLDLSVEVLRRLRAIGVHLAIDDFGTGYSSLCYLKQLPVDVLKLDRSIVSGVGTSPTDDAIVSAMVALGHALGLGIVAEGVETAEQWDALAGIGCDRAQGFLFGQPAMAPNVAAYVGSSR